MLTLPFRYVIEKRIHFGEKECFSMLASECLRSIGDKEAAATWKRERGNGGFGRDIKEG
jgi:hypothetical protein